MAHYLVGKGFQVRVIDNFMRASPETLQSFSPDIEIRRVDVRDFDSLVRFLDVDVVFHFAALTDVVESESERSLYRSINIEGTRNVLEAALRYGAKVVFASSAAVYGELNRPARESDEPSPISFYGVTKLEGENLCMEYFRKGLETIILRFFNVFGERARGGVVRIFLEKGLRGEPLVIYGDGEAVRDFIYVGDVVEAAFKAFEEKSASGRIFNVGSGKPVKVIELAKLVSKLTGAEIIHKPPRSGEIGFSLADISLIRRTLGWSPVVSVFEWIEEKIKGKLHQTNKS